MPAISALLLAVSAGCAGVAALVWTRRRAAGGRALLAFAVAVAVWNAGYAFEIAVADPVAKLRWAQAEYLGIATIPVAFFAFAVAYAGRLEWASPRRLAALAVPSAVVLALVWTNDAHGLVWASVRGPVVAGAPLAFDHGPAFYPYWAYSYLLLLAAAVVLLSSHLQVHRYHRRQTLALGAAAAVPWACNALYVLGDLDVDLTTVGFAVTALLLWVACGRWGLLTSTPVARSLVVEHMRGAMVVLDASGRVTDCNAAAGAVLRCPAGEAVGRAAADVLPAGLATPPAAPEPVRVVEVDTAEGRRAYDVEWVDLPAGGRRGSLLLLHDVTAREALHAHLTAAAMTDPLTGVGNRRQLVDQLERALAAATRDRRELAVLVLDLDDFKPLNDTYGHAFGDEVLAVTAARLQRAVRPGDCVARLGGDEFAVLLPDLDDAGTAAAVAQRAVAAVAEPLVVAGRVVTVHASAGVHVAAGDGQSPESLLGAADREMYRSKRARPPADRHAPAAAPRA